jgi:hypothetical protein
MDFDHKPEICPALPRVSILLLPAPTRSAAEGAAAARRLTHVRVPGIALARVALAQIPLAQIPSAHISLPHVAGAHALRVQA